MVILESPSHSVSSFEVESLGLILWFFCLSHLFLDLSVAFFKKRSCLWNFWGDLWLLQSKSVFRVEKSDIIIECTNFSQICIRICPSKTAWCGIWTLYDFLRILLACELVSITALPHNGSDLAIRILYFLKCALLYELVTLDSIAPPGWYKVDVLGRNWFTAQTFETESWISYRYWSPRLSKRLLELRYHITHHIILHFVWISQLYLRLSFSQLIFQGLALFSAYLLQLSQLSFVFGYHFLISDTTHILILSLFWNWIALSNVALILVALLLDSFGFQGIDISVLTLTVGAVATFCQIASILIWNVGRITLDWLLIFWLLLLHIIIIIIIVFKRWLAL